MVRCEEFYRYFEKNGNFCGKSDIVVKQIEEYIAYVRRNKIGTYKISNCALDPFINIEHMNNGIVHRYAVKELKSLIKKEKIAPEKITRKMSVEIINKANNKVGKDYKLGHIPGIRGRMGNNEHDIRDISFDTRKIFDELKKDIGMKNNDQAMRIVLECCIKNLDDMRKIKGEMEDKEKVENDMEIVKST